MSKTDTVEGGTPSGAGQAEQDYFGQFRSFQKDLPGVVGSFMTSISDADVRRQVAWTRQLQSMFEPDKSGKVPTVDLKTHLDFSEKSASGGGTDLSTDVGVQFPVGLAIMGDQLAGSESTFNFSMNLDASALDETQSQTDVGGEGEVHWGIGPFSVGVKVHAEMSSHSDHKRESDFRATCDATLTMTRVPTPEPVQRALDVWSDLVTVQGQIARARMTDAAQKTAQAQKLIPASPDSGGGKNG